ncbi:hypothetical protein [Phaeobacter sp.]|uniref:hypothetical protein n=1 Tax=Phaeobacter sp. TaxID=1902409 RepID=UPI0025EC93C7|nr:hypothetical protein [Phaeobacter sp.]
MIFKRLSIAALCAVYLAAPAFADVETYLNGFCDAQDFDTHQCACAKTTFTTETAQRELTPEQRAMAALFLGQPGLDVMVFAEAMQTIDRSVMPSVIPVVGQLQAPIYQTCVEVDANTFTVEETKTKERYLQACIFMSGQDAEEKALCSCQADAFAQQYDDETFLLITETLEVEASGESGDMDPLEYLMLNKRGMSQAQAMDFMMVNQGLFMEAPMILMSCAQDVTGTDMNLKALMQGVIQHDTQ